MMNVSDIKKILCGLEAVYEGSHDYLSELDAAIGDGDHGTSMVRGFKAVNNVVCEKNFDTISSLMTQTGKTLMKEIGGTCGPLYAMLFIKGGQAIGDTVEWDAGCYYRFLSEGARGLMELGGAQPGDKTMVDALMPAIEALKTAMQEGKDILTAARLAAQAAKKGADNTKDMISKKGRGRYQKENSSGHIDAGAASMALLLNAFIGEL